LFVNFPTDNSVADDSEKTFIPYSRDIQELPERGIGHWFPTGSENFHFCTLLSVDTKSYLRGRNTAGGSNRQIASTWCQKYDCL